ncbi:GNAT family N-acetyltransferase [Macrococcus armenti]|uniref:GNAT family N-acetyltransferase n=1 Tax=Macrococcus armenti TaxID=2875764 RepID=UPI001CCBE745|nr:GNAT family N-acetyltransferase [Macrococcus armenti]UBH22423.1 GNAT family N-acetyltransferase [Macrococcus armenti]
MRLEEVNRTNIDAIINLKVKEEQKYYVAPNIRSLADAYVYRNDGVNPYAVINKDRVIGFIMFDKHESKESVCIIWRMMIGEQYQGNGYGRMLIELAKEHAIEKGYQYIMADYIKDNLAVKNLLESSGFKEQGIDDYNQVIMIYKL